MLIVIKWQYQVRIQIRQIHLIRLSVKFIQVIFISYIKRVAVIWVSVYKYLLRIHNKSIALAQKKHVLGKTPVWINICRFNFYIWSVWENNAECFGECVVSLQTGGFWQYNQHFIQFLGRIQHNMTLDTYKNIFFV